jgi:hypothetical protein
MEAAIPMSCYMPDAERSSRLEDKDVEYPTPDYHRNPTTNEMTLGYRGYISNVTANLINFYNDSDWALATGRSEIVPGFPTIETNWEKNQIDYKPDGEDPRVSHSFTWRYYYEPSRPPILPVSQRGRIESAVSRVVSDSWEMKAFISRSRTKAVGAFPAGGSLGTTEDLRSEFGFGAVRADHSGQFTRNIQTVDVLYKKMREKIEQ